MAGLRKRFFTLFTLPGHHRSDFRFSPHFPHYPLSRRDNRVGRAFWGPILLEIHVLPSAEFGGVFDSDLLHVQIQVGVFAWW